MASASFNSSALNSAPANELKDKIVEYSQFDFHGGIHPVENKTLSNQVPIRRLPTPDRVVIPLLQHKGQSAQAIVDVGDQVLKGQLIAAAEGNISANIHASISGKVTAIEARPITHPGA
ncbi:MAG: hypothetical protein V2I33_09675, partial [Kangiellaceae bacterium]|nr:hypothetical protein [Kangiellaceae bacterium]